MKAIYLLAFCELLLQCGLLCQGSKFNPKVKVRTQELGTTESNQYSSTSGERYPSRSKSLNPTCAGVNCMPQPIPAQGSPPCKPRYDGDSCCPTWICASDEILAKGLFDENNNWNVKNEYQHDMFEDIHHHDEDEEHEHEEDDEDIHHPHPTPHPDVTDKPYGPQLEEFMPQEKKSQFQKYAAKGKLDNKHKSFIARMEHEKVSVTSSPPAVEEPKVANEIQKDESENTISRESGNLKGREQSISDNYAAFKRNLQKRAQLRVNDEKVMPESAQAQVNDYAGVNDYNLE